jgi:hypothetical protein
MPAFNEPGCSQCPDVGTCLVCGETHPPKLFTIHATTRAGKLYARPTTWLEGTLAQANAEAIRLNLLNPGSSFTPRAAYSMLDCRYAQRAPGR